jgi:hypothetical protein
MFRMRALTLLLAPAIGACAWTGAPAATRSASTFAPYAALAPVPRVRPPAHEEGASLPGDVAQAIESRLESLEQRGGACAVYAAVLEKSYREGRITLRPFMWRVEGRLVSGQAMPNGDMVLARDIDPLNVGVRTVDDVLWSVEHESAHIAFRIANGDWAGQDPADRYVRECRASAAEG